MTRLAVLSDVHGNLDALQAVLADLKNAGGADHIWMLGDFAAFGYDPAGCVQYFKDNSDIKSIYGNTDRYLFSGARPKMSRISEENWEKIVKGARSRDLALAWGMEKLSWAEVDYLAKLPTDLSLEVEDYGWVVGFHAAPGNDELMIMPDTPDTVILDALLDREGRLAFGGHTHIAGDRDLGTWRFVNPGSVGLPWDGDQRASYALVTFADGNADVDIRRVEYDVEAVIAKLEASDNPFLETMTRRLRTAQM